MKQSKTITPQQTIALLDAWLAGEVDGEIICDAMIDLGMDPDAGPKENPARSFRGHFRHCTKRRLDRLNCLGQRSLRKILLTMID